MAPVRIHLRPQGVLCPAEGVHDGHGPVGRGRGGDHFGYFKELLLGCAADLFHHLRRIAAVVLSQELIDAIRSCMSGRF